MNQKKTANFHFRERKLLLPERKQPQGNFTREAFTFHLWYAISGITDIFHDLRWDMERCFNLMHFKIINHVLYMAKFKKQQIAFYLLSVEGWFKFWNQINLGQWLVFSLLSLMFEWITNVWNDGQINQNISKKWRNFERRNVFGFRKLPSLRST